MRKALSEMKQRINDELGNSMLLPSAKKLLKSLNRHWEGLNIFVDYPWIPMDNNKAERGLRPNVVGRKNYYGSGAIWSAYLTAALSTIFETLKLWGINLHTWLLAYFHECAIYDGQTPEKIDGFLPWNMTEEQKRLLSQPPKFEQLEYEIDSS